MLLLMAACHDTPDYQPTVADTFTALSRTVATRYCFLEQKGIDWQGVENHYRPMLDSVKTDRQLFDLCAAMLDTLRDGHVNLSSPAEVSYYRRWWTDYPQDFNLRVVQEYYLDFDYSQAGVMTYKMLPDSVAYLRISSFGSEIHPVTLDAVLGRLAGARALILDIRDNGGGLLTNISELVSRFINGRTAAGAIAHKTGPGPADFSEPYTFYYEPDADHLSWEAPVILLTNRSCYSAANTLTAVMRSLPGVTVVGARTGGGGGLPFSATLPCGWVVRFSACPVYGPDGQCIEEGVDPTPGHEVHCTPADFASGRDPILDHALSLALEGD